MKTVSSKSCIRHTEGSATAARRVRQHKIRIAEEHERDLTMQCCSLPHAHDGIRLYLLLSESQPVTRVPLPNSFVHNLTHPTWWWLRPHTHLSYEPFLRH
ncbi:hypothetical protein FHG87_009557 [Trinorchestia longiramus]|nr:hypothetical protein FHG87_009557 [Trinorchestia longiramus]